MGGWRERALYLLKAAQLHLTLISEMKADQYLKQPYKLGHARFSQENVKQSQKLAINELPKASCFSSLFVRYSWESDFWSVSTGFDFPQ